MTYNPYADPTAGAQFSHQEIYPGDNPARYLPEPSYVQDNEQYVSALPALSTAHNVCQWPNAVYQPQFASLPGNIQTLQDGPDLTGFTADPSAVDSLDASNLTSGLHDGPWQPGTMPQSQRMDKTRAASDSMLLRQMIRDIPSTGDDMADSAIGSLLSSPMNAAHRAHSQQGATFVIPTTSAVRLNRSESAKSSREAPQAAGTSRVAESRTAFVEHACPIAKCKRIIKSKSDQTKHAKQHDRPYPCEVASCPYAMTGFGTPNDASRHMRDKHGIRSKKDEGYICRDCPYVDGMPKWWPRKDNFKAHIKRKHKGVDIAELIQASYYPSRPDDTFSDIGTAPSAQLSNYYSQSQADSEPYHHQYDYPASAPHSAMLLQNQSQYQGELWEAQADYIQQSNELQDASMAHHTDHALPCYRPSGSRRPGRPITSTSTSRYEQNATTSSSSISLSRVVPAATSPALRKHQQLDCTEPGEQTAVQTRKRTAPDDEQTTNKRLKEGCSMKNGTRRSKPLVSQCTICHKQVTNITKHTIRHTRPFECTAIQCFESFGSKADWIRHETARHAVREGYLCTLTKHDGMPCFKYKDTKDKFRQHLAKAAHYVSAAQIDIHVEEMRLGKYGAVRFWCGFCKAVIDNPKLDEKKAWKARCVHIGKHLDEAGRRQKLKWTCVSAQMHKKDMTQELKLKLHNGEELEAGTEDNFDPDTAFRESLLRDEMRASLWS